MCKVKFCWSSIRRELEIGGCGVGKDLVVGKRSAAHAVVEGLFKMGHPEVQTDGIFPWLHSVVILHGFIFGVHMLNR